MCVYYHILLLLSTNKGGMVIMRNERILKDEKYLTVFEAESMTGRKAATWRRDILLKRISVVKFGRCVRIPLSEIHRLVNEGFQQRVEG